MAETKLARLTLLEIQWLHVFRNVRDSDQLYLLEIAEQIVAARRPSIPNNVILLSDPFRKFPKRTRG
jgi:hypothetical protein